MSAEPEPQGGPEARPGEPGPLRVLYVTMQFPVPSEAFAAVEQGRHLADVLVDFLTTRLSSPGDA